MGRKEHVGLCHYLLSIRRSFRLVYSRIGSRNLNYVRPNPQFGNMANTLSSIRGENQFKNWFIYFLIVFVVSTLVAEIFFLNKALALFNTAMVTPTYYVSIGTYFRYNP